MNIFHADSHTYRLERLHSAPGEFVVTLEDPAHGHEWPSDTKVSQWAGCKVRYSEDLGIAHARIYEVSS